MSAHGGAAPARPARPATISGAWLAFVPLALLALACAGVALSSDGAVGRLQLDRAWAPPSSDAWCGCGEGGVDVALLAVHAVLRALGLGLVVALLGFALGTPLGALAGLRGGAVERMTLQACDLLQAFPSFLLALAVLAAVSTPSRLHIGLVFALTAWAPFARIAAAQARVLADSTFVEAAIAIGVRPSAVLVRHVLPNLLGPVTVQLGTSAAGVVLGETALGFVGLGPSDGVSLGGLLDQGTVAMLRAPHVLLAGAVAVAATSGSLQLAAEGLRRLGTRAS